MEIDRSSSVVARELAVVGALDRLETAARLDAAVAAVDRIVARVPRSVRALLHGVPAGHPLHPAAVLVPAGAWISAAVLDFVPGSARAARTLVGVGIVSAVPAAAMGLADWGESAPRQKRLGVVHAASNAVAVGLYAVSWVRRGRGASGRLSSLAGLAVVSASGYLGGHLAYRTPASSSTDTAAG